MGQLVGLVCVVVLLVVSLALFLVALLTDNWYRVNTPDNIDPEARRSNNFHYGLWRLCYDEMPKDIAYSRYSREGECIYIHKELIQKSEERLNFDQKLRIHLSRTVVGCSIAASTLLVACLLTLLLGLWPARCDRVKRPRLYLIVSVIMLLATVSGMVSGICFIAVRDLDNVTFRSGTFMPPAVPPYASQVFDWSFMLHWIAVGLAFIDSFFLLCLLWSSYEFVHQKSKLHDYSDV